MFCASIVVLVSSFAFIVWYELLIEFDIKLKLVCVTPLISLFNAIILNDEQVPDMRLTLNVK